MPRVRPVLPGLLFAAAFAATGPAAPAQLPDADSNRWRGTASQTDRPLVQGDPTILTWGFVADGTQIAGGVGEAQTPSNLISRLDGIYGVTGGGADLTQRVWFGNFSSVFDRYEELSGLSYRYTAADDGVILNGISQAVLGTRADVRIGGHRVDGNGGTLAYNYFPIQNPNFREYGGDMVIDTADSFYDNTGGDSIRLRNVVSHEHGHGIGQPHYVSGNNNGFGGYDGLLEPFANTSFDGPQLVDIYQTQRSYGDALEKDGGNDAADAANVLDLGTFTAVDDMLAIGLDAAKLIVDPADTGFFSIDDDSDTDFYEFSLAAVGTLNVLLEPLGLTLNVGPQGSSPASRPAVDLSAQSDLSLALFGADGLTLLGLADFNGLGGSEELTQLLGPGTYFARVQGRQNAAQFYGLSFDFDAVAAVPEPGTWALVLFAAGGAAVRRRRRTIAAAA